MNECVIDLHFHFNGLWMLNPIVHYVGDDVVVQHNVDLDLICLQDIEDKFWNSTMAKSQKMCTFIRRGRTAITSNKGE